MSESTIYIYTMRDMTFVESLKLSEFLKKYDTYRNRVSYRHACDWTIKDANYHIHWYNEFWPGVQYLGFYSQQHTTELKA